MKEFEELPKDVLSLIIVLLDSSSLINLCVASKRIRLICKTDECRFAYYRARYNLINKYLLEWEEYYDNPITKYKEILQYVYDMTSDGARDLHYELHQARTYSTDDIHNCEQCATIDAKDFTPLLRILINEYPKVFVILESSSMVRGRTPKNIAWLFKLCSMVHQRHKRSISENNSDNDNDTPPINPNFSLLPFWFVKKYYQFM
jgi:hypothetical protein